MMNRRAALRASLGVVASAGLTGGCRRTNTGVLRLGYFPNLTHAPALTGVGSGRLARALAPARLETRTFNAGPEAMEALLANALDASYVGPSPAVVAWIRTRGHALRVVAGATSGGATFVVRTAAGIHGPADLRGRRLGTPQLGGTQDIALRAYLQSHGLGSTDRGGDVRVIPMSNPDILTQFRLGELDGAWVPEPWGSRLVAEGGGEVLLDERDLWPGRAFATTVLVVRDAYLREARANVARLVRAHVDEVARIRRDPAAARAEANAEIQRRLGRALPAALLDAAWGRMDFTTDPLVSTLQANAHAAHTLGYLAGEDLAGLVDTSLLREALAATGGGTN